MEEKINQLERKIESIELINKLYSDALYEIVRMGRKSEPEKNMPVSLILC